MTQTDELVAAYLARVEQAASRLPAGRREELLGDLREHIEIARAESETGTEAEVRTILDRLGDPESIVAAADTQTDIPRVTPPPPFTPPPFTPPPFTPASPPRPNLKPLWVLLGLLAVGAVIVLCLGLAFFVPSDSGPAPSVENAPPAPAATATATVEPSE
ncbi:hypothetical protein GCM10025331_30690 [Actinoplanes utahensis]|nr:hypothetical protein Aut01nite_32410 [Actinoplanes utahensis]